MAEMNDTGPGGDSAPASQDLNPVDAIQRILDRESPETPAEEEDAEEGQETGAAEDPEQSTDDEAPEADDPAEGEEDEAQPDKSQHPEFAKPDTKVRLEDGTETTVAELVKGGLRQADYTRKTQEVAHERQRLAQIDHQVQQAVVNLTTLAEHIIPPAPDEALWETDYFEAAKQQRQHNKFKEMFDAVVAMGQQAQQRQQAEHINNVRGWAQQEFARLAERRPELKDPKRWNEYKQDAIKVLAEYDIPAQEFEHQYDSRIHRLLFDFLRARKLAISEKTAREKVKSAPPVMRPGTRQDANARGRSAVEEAKKRVKRTGSKADGLAALLKMDL